MKNLLLLLAVLVCSSLYAQKNKVSKGEKDFAIKYLSTTQQELINITQDLTEKELSFKPNDGGWSVLNCLEHIAVTEKALFGQIKELVAAGKIDPSKDYSSRDGLILTSVSDRAKKAKTLEPFEPSGRWNTKTEVLAQISNSRSEMIEYLKKSKADLRHLISPSPVGEVDAYQLFLIAGAHGYRHTMQIREVLDECKNKKSDTKEDIAKKYFDAFKQGRLDEVYSYLSENCVVQYGTEPPKPATSFFHENTAIIATLEFKTKGVYTSEKTHNVLIDFSFTVPGKNGEKGETIDAVDIIEFDESGKIQKIKVIPNT